MDVIKTQGINKFYGRNHILKDVSISVSEGTIFALLGPNGAGKTTFIQSVLNLTRIKSGTIELNGKCHCDHKSRQGVAYLPESFNFYPYYTVKGVLNFYFAMYNNRTPKNIKKQKLDEVISKYELDSFINQKIGTLSKGQKQRTGLASLMLGDNKVFIIDEPFSGLDPIAISDFKKTILCLKEEGKTVFLNSHILSDVEKMCDEMAILKNGSCLAQGKIAELKGSSGLEEFFVKMIRGESHE